MPTENVHSRGSPAVIRLRQSVADGRPLHGPRYLAIFRQGVKKVRAFIAQRWAQRFCLYLQAVSEPRNLDKSFEPSSAVPYTFALCDDEQVLDSARAYIMLPWRGKNLIKESASINPLSLVSQFLLRGRP